MTTELYTPFSLSNLEESLPKTQETIPPPGVKQNPVSQKKAAPVSNYGSHLYDSFQVNEHELSEEELRAFAEQQQQGGTEYLNNTTNTPNSIYPNLSTYPPSSTQGNTNYAY